MQTVELVGRLLVSLAVVIGLLWLIARRARRGGRRRIRSGRLIDVLGRQALSRSSSVAVVRVLDQALVLGVTDNTVSVLGSLELDAVQARLVALDGGGAGPVTADRTDGGDAAPARARVPAARREAAGERDVAARRAAANNSGGLAGSALSPATWRQTIDALREMTARRG